MLATLDVTTVALVDDFVAEPLQCEQQEFSFYNRLGGDRGEAFFGGGDVNWGSGFVDARIFEDGQFAGVFESLNLIRRENLPLNLQALLPQQIVPAFQQRATALLIDIIDGTGTFKLEIKSPAEDVLLQHFETLQGGPLTLRIPLNSPPTNAQLLVFGVEGTAGSFVQVRRVAIESVGPELGAASMFVWPYGALLRNFSETTGLTRDRANFPAGDMDNVSASGLQALAAAVASDLGVISRTAAINIVQRTTQALLNIPRFQGVLPHFVRGGVIQPGTEYSSLDTIIAWLGALLASQSLGLPTQSLEQAFRDLGWDSLRLPNGLMSHGYTEQGVLLQSGWDTFGGETFLAALGQAMGQGTVPTVTNPNPPTFNGSGFIDELAWLFVPAPKIDIWGNDWALYRKTASQTQVNDAAFAQLNQRIFGLSAAEVPAPWDVPCPNMYQAFGVGGIGPRNDGTQFFGRPVAAPHYAGMVASLQPQAVRTMWTFLRQSGLVSPLNSVESLFLNSKRGTVPLVWNSLKGSLNLSLTALGVGKRLLGDPNYTAYQAAEDNAFVGAGRAKLANVVIDRIFDPPSRMVEAGREDLFGFTPKRNGVLSVQIQFSNSKGNLDLEIRTAAGNVLASSTTMGDEESVELTVQGLVPLQIRVFSPSGASNAYDLIQQFRKKRRLRVI